MKMKVQKRVVLSLACLVLEQFVNAQTPQAGTSAQDLADKLANPVASLISVPIQNNLDYGIGAYQGSKYTINVQPVVPFSLGKNLNLITRYIIPIVDQSDLSEENSSLFGLSDATLSAFFSPKKNRNGIIWGAGPAFLVPIGTDDLLSTRKWGLGPTALVLHQAKGVTVGFLVNQLWSIAGDEDRSDINQMFLQPFLSHAWKSGASLGINSEMTFDWQNNTNTIFLNPYVSGITKLGTQTISLSIGPRIPLAAPSGQEPDFGLRATLSLVFPQ
jgi:hypothetical protein